jgi:hypothetical protein
MDGTDALLLTVVSCRLEICYSLQGASGTSIESKKVPNRYKEKKKAKGLSLFVVVRCSWFVVLFVCFLAWLLCEEKSGKGAKNATLNPLLLDTKFVGDVRLRLHRRHRRRTHKNVGMKYECTTSSMKLVRQSRIFGETNEFGLVAPPPLFE